MQYYTPAQIEAIRHENGLDKTLVMQYFDWMAHICRGDFGKSLTEQTSPLDIFKRTLPRTLHLSVLAFIISFILGIPAGVICTLRRGTWIDTTVTVLANIGITIPVFWLGTLLIFVFSLKFNWLPVQGYVSPFANFAENSRQIIMPVFCLTIFPLSAITRQTRSSMLEVMGQDYIRTAWAKGFRERYVVIKHALKNGLIPVVTLAGMQLSGIVGGSVLIETIFNIQGVGLALVNAIFAHDFPVVQGFSMIIGVTILVINLLVDISFGWLDPRIRYA